MKYINPTIILINVFFALLIVSKVRASEGSIDVTPLFCKNFDFANLLTPKNDFLGFIDPNYQRLSIKFLSVSKSTMNPNIYLIKGKSTVKHRTCSFSGTIKVDKIEKFPSIDYGIDEEYKNQGIRSEGEFYGTYDFRENKDQKFSGIFKGTMTLHWYIDKHGNPKYDDIGINSDDYNNNQYSGTWTPYEKRISKVASWGEYRIPNSGDLDIGTGDFIPNPKYKNNGW